MKKTLSLVSVATMLVGAVNVASAKTVANEKGTTISPEIYLSVFDMSTEPVMDLKTTNLPRGKENLQLCWLAQGQFNQQTVSVIETLKAPAKQEVASPGSQISTLKDGKVNVVRSTLETLEEGKQVARCWSFDESDPLGKYTFQVQIMGKIYPDLPFSVVK